MNRVTMIGRLTRDPEQRQTYSGVAVCTFNIAVQRRFTDQNGNKLADFFNIVTWRGLAENCGKYLSKGSRVGVHGNLQTRSYEVDDGTKRTVTEIIAEEVEFLETKQKQADKHAQEMELVEDDKLPF